MTGTREVEEEIVEEPYNEAWERAYAENDRAGLWSEDPIPAYGKRSTPFAVVVSGPFSMSGAETGET